MLGSGSHVGLTSPVWSPVWDSSVPSIDPNLMYSLRDASLLRVVHHGGHHDIIRGYHHVQFTPGLWRHVWQTVIFTLVVDNFDVKFVGEEHAKHLIMVLEKCYDITVDWDGKKYVGIDLK